jgi:hypothetical protein
VLKEVGGRLSFLSNVGLDYRPLDRAPDAGGGETQRFVWQEIGCGLVGVLSVLDDVDRLHPRDNGGSWPASNGCGTWVNRRGLELMKRPCAHAPCRRFRAGPGFRGGDVVDGHDRRDRANEKSVKVRIS